jgi:uncharacterized protein
MKKSFLWAALMLAALAVPAFAQGFFPITTLPTIQVNGEGSMWVEPDRARLFMRVSEIRPSVAEAKSAVDSTAMQIQKMLIEMGVEKSQINASQFSIRREDREDSKKPSARPQFHVSRQITVNLLEIARLDAVLDRSVALGINEIWQVDLYTSREAELKLEAMLLALQNARRKAEVMAIQIERPLGKVYMAEYEFGGGGAPVYRLAMQDFGAAPEFARGTIRIEARVNVVFEIE